MAEAKALREILLRYERATVKFRRQIGHTGSVIDAMDALKGAMRGPRELPDALAHFEATRRRARQALLAVAIEQDVGVGEMARRLGFSRQLAYRLARGSDLWEGRAQPTRHR